MGDTKTELLSSDTKAELVENAKALLKITDGDSDALLDLLTDDTAQAIVSYCRLEELPRQLEGFIPVITAARFRENEADGIKEISEGERRVEYGDTKNHFLNEYAERLKPFMSRRVKLPSEMEDIQDDKSV